MKKTRLFAILSIICTHFCTFSQAQDSIKRPIVLEEVQIVSPVPNPLPDIQQAATPLQVVGSQELAQRGSTLLSDAVKQLSGISLKDYGGVGGIKTVSARGLGSQFSTLTIDGVPVNDCQNGQVDLGRYQLGGTSHVTLTSGQPHQTFPTARALAAGSIIDMQTLNPVFSDRPYNLGFGLAGGSFGYLSPTLSYEQRMGHSTSLSLYASHSQSEGNYPYTLYYTKSRSDSSSRETRENSQMRLTTADINLFHSIGSNQELRVKGHYMQGFHALPGPVIYYTAKGSEHSEEQLAFAQALYRLQGSRMGLQLLAKYQYSNDIYEDTAARSPSHVLHNEYQQQEAYLSQVASYRHGEEHREHWVLKLSADEALSTLNSNLSSHNDVQRMSMQGALSADYYAHLISALKGLQASAHLLGTYVQDQEADMQSDPYKKFSPYAGVTWRMKHVTLRYFYKESYRVPNFNELYYFTVGRALRPEKAAQHNLGLTAQFQSDDSQNHSKFQNWSCSASVNGYYNRVSDKIIAVPTQNMFLWSMSNLGEVRIWGIDANCNSLWAFPQWTLRTDIGYSFQHATDQTDPSAKCYGHQIPYTPRHSGNFILTAETRWIDISYSATWVGSRYSASQNTPANCLPAYLDQGITLTRSWDWMKALWEVKAQVLNLFDVQYEVVRNYPMMGRNYRVGLNVKLL